MRRTAARGGGGERSCGGEGRTLQAVELVAAIVPGDRLEPLLVNAQHIDGSVGNIPVGVVSAHQVAARVCVQRLGVLQAGGSLQLGPKDVNRVVRKAKEGRDAVVEARGPARRGGVVVWEWDGRGEIHTRRVLSAIATHIEPIEAPCELPATPTPFAQSIFPCAHSAERLVESPGPKSFAALSLAAPQ